MEKNQTILKTVEKIAEINIEQSVDTEFTLPDYYPEISRILKNLTEVYFTKSLVKNNKIEIVGQVSMTMLYADKDENLSSFSHIFAFSKSVDTDIQDECIIDVLLRDEFLNTKATAQRKVEVHGSLNLNITATVQKNIKLPCTFENNVFAKNENVLFTEQYLPIVKSMFLEDEISIGQNRQPISKILRSNAFVKINESKVVSGKIVVKGELLVNILYCPVQSSRPILIEHTHNFSQIIDGDGVGDTCYCKAMGSVTSFEIHPKTSLDGDVKAVNFEAKVNIEVKCEKELETNIVTDAFSQKYCADAECLVLNVLKIQDKIQENFICKKNLDFTDGSISEIYDVWCKNYINFVSCENGEILIKGNVVINILGCDSNASAMFFERSVDYEYRYSLENNQDYICEPSVSVTAVNYVKNPDGGIDVAVELVVESTIYSFVELKAVMCLKENENEPVKFDSDTAITLYFAEDESVWDIAKRYFADPEKICSANCIDNIDCICNKILLIPNM